MKKLLATLMLLTSTASLAAAPQETFSNYITGQPTRTLTTSDYLPVVNGSTYKITIGGLETFIFAAPVITGHPTIEGVTSTGATGTGNFVFSIAPTITGHLTIEGVTSTGATGTGQFVFGTSPTLTTPTISGHFVAEGVTSTGATGTGALVFGTSPTLTTPALGVATATSLALGGATIGSNALAVTGTTALGGTTTLGSTSTNWITAQGNSAGNGPIINTAGETNVDLNVWTKGSGAISLAPGQTLQAKVNFTSGADRYLTFTGGVSGSSTNPTIGTSGGNLAFSPAGTVTQVAGTGPIFGWNNTSLGADLKQWDSVVGAGANLIFRAVNDAYSATTTAYQITRGTTYNVASHTWYTSTVAGTPVQGMQLDSNSALNIGTGSYSVAGSTANLWVNSDAVLNSSGRSLMGNIYFATSWKYTGNGTGGYVKFGASSTDAVEIGYAPNNAGGAGAAASPAAAVIVSNAGALAFPQVSTTASAANAFLDNANSNNLLRSTSALKYKADVATIPLADALAVLNLTPVTFRSLASADGGARFVGMIANQAAGEAITVDGAGNPLTSIPQTNGMTSLVNYSNGEVEGFDYDRMPVYMLRVMQYQEDRITAVANDNADLRVQLKAANDNLAALTARVAALEAAK